MLNRTRFVHQLCRIKGNILALASLRYNSPAPYYVERLRERERKQMYLPPTRRKTASSVVSRCCLHAACCMSMSGRTPDAVTCNCNLPQFRVCVSVNLALPQLKLPPLRTAFPFEGPKWVLLECAAPSPAPAEAPSACPELQLQRIVNY